VGGSGALERLEREHEGKVAIVLPALNEEQSIGQVLSQVAQALQNRKHELLVVDGKSQDHTVDIAQSKGAQVITQKDTGYGDALQHGFSHACEYLGASELIMMDADGSYRADDIPELLGPIDRGEADIVIGNRFAGLEKGSMSITSQIGNKILSLFARWALKVKISDTQCGMRALRAEVCRSLDTKTTGMPFAIEMIAEAQEMGFKMCEIPIGYRRRIGHSKLSPIEDGTRILVTTLRLARDYQPLAFFGTIGATVIVLGVAQGASVLEEYLRTGTITRLASVVLSSTLIVSGVLVLILGLIADMIKDLKHLVRRP